MLYLPRKSRCHPYYLFIAGLPRTSLEVLRILHLPRKTSRKYYKYCLCHIKPAGGTCQQNAIEMLQVSYLLYKTNLRCSKYWTCHVKKITGIHIAYISPDFRRTLWRCCKCWACHTKQPCGTPSIAPITQNKPEGIQMLYLPRKSNRHP